MNVPQGQPGPAAADRTARFGALFGLSSAVCFGMVVVLARVAYDGGASAGAVIELRFLLAVAAMAVILRLRRGSFTVPRRVRPTLCGLSLGVLFLTLGYLSSILFIPVSLAVVIFYTYPLMVAAAAPLFEKTRLGPKQLVAFPVAFASLVLALGPSVGGLDGRGVALALLAAVSAAYLFIASPRAVAAYDVFGVGLYINLACAGLMIPVLLVSGGLALPESAGGWTGIAGVGLFYVCATASQFAALGVAGAVKTALVFNIEPVVAIAGAAILLGERLTTPQLGGVALVLGALVLASLARPKA